MDRVPYRRVSPPRNGAAASDHRQKEYNNHSEGDPVSHGETLIMQCIICGVIMVFVLIASMVDIAPAVALRGGINQVLTGAETLDELITDVRRFGSDWLGLEWEPADNIAMPDEFYPPALPYDEPFESVVLPTADYDPAADHDYIDETPAADDEASNPTVPEPLVTPGLWD